MFEVHTAISKSGWSKDLEYAGVSKWHTEEDFIRYCNMMDDISHKWCHHKVAIEGEKGRTSILCVSYVKIMGVNKEVGRTRYSYAKRKQDLFLPIH